MRRSRPVAAFVAAPITVLAVLGSACGGPPPEACAFPRTSVETGLAFDAIPVETLAPVLSPSADIVACSGVSAGWPDLPEGCAASEPPAETVEDPTNGDALVRGLIGEPFWIAWRPERHFRSGLAEGPIAVLRRTEAGVEARALGTLRALPRRARLEVAHIGSAYVLFAQGERCEADGSGCRRGTRLVFLDGRRFVSAPLLDEHGTCLGPAFVWQSEVRTVTLENRVERRFERSLTLSHDDTAVSLDELVIVQDRDLRQPSAPSRLFRRAEGHRTIHVDEGRFVVSGTSLWEGILEDAASVQEDVGGPRR